MVSLWLDHLVVSARSLEDGAVYVEKQLDTSLSPGGQHALMATHNRLLGLGGESYLEVIAPDPTAPAPGRPRWFDLDALKGPPRLTNWVCRTDDLEAALQRAPAGMGAPIAFERGNLKWKMAVPENGQLPFDGMFPALIEWQGGHHPAAQLPDRGVRLNTFRVFHPDPRELIEAMRPFASLDRVSIEKGGVPGLEAIFDTPSGQRVLR